MLGHEGWGGNAEQLYYLQSIKDSLLLFTPEYWDRINQYQKILSLKITMAFIEGQLIYKSLIYYYIKAENINRLIMHA